MEEYAYMWHIIIEATPKLADGVDFKSIMAEDHQRFAESGVAAMDDLKSRVHITRFHLAGSDSE